MASESLGMSIKSAAKQAVEGEINDIKKNENSIKNHYKYLTLRYTVC
jgi:hypothetical protein